MKPSYSILLLISFMPLLVQSQEDDEVSKNTYAKLGIVRMVTRKTDQPSRKNELEQTVTTESFFDRLGRLVRTEEDACNNCGSVQSYDSLNGKLVYVYQSRQSGYREYFYLYETNPRRTTVEQCNNGEADQCITFLYEYDEENTERVYQSYESFHLKRDTSKQTKRFYRIYNDREFAKTLTKETFFSPEGQKEETRFFKAGSFHYALLYEYDEPGRLTKIWHFNGKIKQLYQVCERNESGQIVTWKTYKPCIGDPLHALSQPSVNNYEYDDRGLLVKMSSTRTTVEYTYFTE